ncbi:MAG: class I SAM-dependent methyltransferase, partial [Silvanigrellaceae bacterium]|nr:class I SAM-dependent methyltransferase [Silvanigrellaceae bacterium]
IPDSSVDLVTIFIGLHHAPPHKLEPFVKSVFRVMRSGGVLLLRDHNATEEMKPIVNLAHSTFNAGTGVSYHDEITEIRNFQPLSYWISLLENIGFERKGNPILQEGDPTANTLVAFIKK